MNGKAIPPQNHNIKRFMEGVDLCHFTSIDMISGQNMDII